MEEENFNQLLTSVQQADDIVKGNATPSRSFEFADKKILDVMFETAEDLNNAGLMSNSKLSEFEELCSDGKSEK
jgi:hypothetical protein